MEQVFVNLFLNAIEATGDNGTLTVATELLTAPTSGFLRPQATDQQQLRVIVADTGTGIAPEHLDRMFEPFFTTKSHGTGLGLPITRRIVQEHNGQITVQSEPQKATTFSIILPAGGSGPLSRPMSRRFHIAVLSDVHYASPREQAEGDDYETRAIENPLLRFVLTRYREHVWLRCTRSGKMASSTVFWLPCRPWTTPSLTETTPATPPPSASATTPRWKARNSASANSVTNLVTVCASTSVITNSASSGCWAHAADCG
ncbi:MAG: ATP-binding protein [Comamonadaceae bacterium]|nr:ATP-binding protein [Comamonadaceae bacterium]